MMLKMSSSVGCGCGICGKSWKIPPDVPDLDLKKIMDCDCRSKVEYVFRDACKKNSYSRIQFFISLLAACIMEEIFLRNSGYGSWEQIIWGICSGFVFVNILKR